jgi:phage-related protein
MTDWPNSGAPQVAARFGRQALLPELRFLVHSGLNYPAAPLDSRPYALTSRSWAKDNWEWLAPVLVSLGTFAGTIGTIVAAYKIWTLVTEAYTAVQAILNVVMMANPIGLIIIAVVALVAGILYLWFHSAAFRDFFIDMWQGIWGFFQGVGHWFANDFVNFFTGAWSWISTKAQEAGDWIHGVWSGVINFFTGMPAKISSIASGMWNGLTSAFKGAINFIIRGWNSLQFGIPRIDTHIPGIGVVGGGSFGVPQIPYLATGGDITQAGMAIVGERGPEPVFLPAGARVLPNSALSGGKPEIHIHLHGSLPALFRDIATEVRGTYGGDVQVALGGAK